MSFGREKRLLLGWLALLAPLPLPFNEVLGWGWYLLFALGVVTFLVRARRDPERWVPDWAVNVLALAYVPFLVMDLFALSGGGLAGPVLRLGLFAILVKLWSLRRERDKWHVVMAVFFVFLAAAATSVHLSVVLYLTAFLVAVMLLLVRFALFHLLSGFGRRNAEGLEVPLGGFLATSAVLCLLVAVPLFALLPRVHSPYLGGPGGMSMGSTIGISGFSDEVTLDSIGSVRTSRQVALRLTYRDMPVPSEIRLKGGAFDRLEGDRWVRSEGWQQVRLPSATRIDLAGDGAVGEVAPPVAGRVDVWLQPLGAKGLPVPVEAVSVAMPARSLLIDRGGALRFRTPPRRPLEYGVEVARERVSVAPAPLPEAEAPTLDLAGVSPRMEELAARVMGEGTVAERASRLERFFTDGGEFRYTLDRVGRAGTAPLEAFLFDHRSGHCEYFASAMVLLLRSQGIHARLAAGFLGGEPSPLGYVVVRQGNAHAWVEAWVPGEGWVVYDPTPAAGRPPLSPTSVGDLVSQLYDSLVFQWDRYVLSYGVEDQVGFLQHFLRGVWGLVAGLRDGGGEETAPAPGEAEPQTAPTPFRPSGQETLPTEWERHLLTGVLVLLALLLSYRLWRAYDTRLTATRAYRRLQDHLSRAGLPFTDATGPLALRRQAAGRWPAAAVPAGRVVDLYLRESFGNHTLVEEEREELRRALEEARRTLKTPAAPEAVAAPALSAPDGDPAGDEPPGNGKPGAPAPGTASPGTASPEAPYPEAPYPEDPSPGKERP